MRDGRALYNEIDGYCCDWLQNLMDAGHIMPGRIDNRSIADLTPDDVAGYERVHFFAGIAGWDLALTIAGWPRGKPIWTGSCPCQPFSAAGKRKGAADERHLWPEMRRLIAARRPVCVAGEQVASKDGRVWLTGIRVDLEAMAYASWSVDACSAGVGAPHIRQRIWWLADTDGGLASDRGIQRGWKYGQQPKDGGAVERLGDADQPGPQGRLDGPGEGGRSDQRVAGQAGQPSGLEHTEGDGWQQRRTQPGGRGAVGGRRSDTPWDWFDIVHCTDGKARRFESFAQPLADGLPGGVGRLRAVEGVFPLAVNATNRVGRLRAYGNAINPYVAAEVLGAYLDGERLRLTGVSDSAQDGVFA